MIRSVGINSNGMDISSEENYIDLDRMLSEKAGKFDLESFNMRDAPIMPSRIHKYDFSDAAVIEVSLLPHLFFHIKKKSFRK